MLHQNWTVLSLLSLCCCCWWWWCLSSWILLLVCNGPNPSESSQPPFSPLDQPRQSASSRIEDDEHVSEKYNGDQQTLSPIVHLHDGSPIRGRLTYSAAGKMVTEFLGIPFAEPPTGRQRFRPPITKKPWTEVFEATRQPRSCPQSRDNYFQNFAGAEMWNANTPLDEDCLHLNVWVAGHQINQRPRLLPVMVWVFGGGFWSGTASLDVYDGKILSSEEDVVVVSMNYRVSLFGFLYLGLADAPGNVGLLDQLEALKWVHRNIAAFGGDPSDVTLFGESAGAASVSLHLLSPLSRPYYKRAILQSGAATAPWALESADVLIERALLLSEACQCNVTIRDRNPDLLALVRCLQQAPVSQLLQHEWVTYEFLDFPWTPVVDHHFLTEQPKALLESGQFKKCELLLGSNHDESIYFIVYYVDKIFKRDELFTKQEFLVDDRLFEQAVYALLPQKYRKNPIVHRAILFEYTDFDGPTTAQRRQQALDKMFGDYHFTCGVNEFARRFQDHGSPVYSYYFTQRSSEQQWPEWMGVLHGYEINYVFGEPLNVKQYAYTEAEKDLARRFMRYWANFARTGNPNVNPDGTWTPELWPKYSQDEIYLILSASTNGTGHGPRRRQCTFWSQYIPKLFAATASLSDVEMKWKIQMMKWEEEYIAEWKHHFEMYKKIQQHSYMDTYCRN
ncbi:Acetylcholinesterase 1 [Trichinella papuae]|uniref:Carboxylic ester hydrolase n=1 Tax=Trichinella papuae TaxID=268474 RepID=A0A0V1MQ84_9BILA|nr:Acetylcholinesterase 1 [Trichinella papuae]